MASGNTNANSGSAKEQLLVCWLEPQSDAGKVSAIPASWIVSTVSGDGRSPDSVVRCRWPRTKRLYRARIVPSSDHPSTKSKDDSVEQGDDSETRSREEGIPSKDDQCSVQSVNMGKEETKPVRHSQSSTPVSSGGSSGMSSNQHAPPAQSYHHQTDATQLAQVLLPHLRKLFNSELNKLSADIQANFDIIGHKISALDGTVKCIKTRVDRMETLLNTAAQELGDSQGDLTTSNNSALNNHSSPLSNTDLLTGAARSLNFNAYKSTADFQTTNSQSKSNKNITSSNRTAPSKNPALSSTSGNSNTQQRDQRSTKIDFGRSAIGQNRYGNEGSYSPVGNGRQLNSMSSTSYSRHQPPSMVSRPSIANDSSITSGGPSKRRRTTASTNPPLPKAVVITAPNGIEIYLGGDKNYKMPLVMYKDALKNCTRPVPTYMVMALIRRYLTADEMSRTWLTEQQLLGKKDGILLDQNLLTALKKQAVMQFPGSGIDDRLLVRKLYDVFHGIRRQMRKKRREAGDLDFGPGGMMGAYGQDDHGSGLSGLDIGGDGEESGSGIEHEEAMEEDIHQIEHGSGGYDDGDQEGEEGYGRGHEFRMERHMRMEDTGSTGGGEEDDVCPLNDDEDLEEVAARHAAFWAGTDDSA